jgi:hypothetical protein
MEIVKREEHIRVDFWRKLCTELGKPLLHWEATELHKIGEIPEGTILVTSSSDAGISEQALEHPNRDLYKLAMAGVAWDRVEQERDTYRALELGPACQPDTCHPSHRYSIKTERWTWMTFPEVPSTVKLWLSCNVNVNHPKIGLIPFGLNDSGHGSDILPDYAGKEKKGYLYVNFQDNSLERIQLKSYLKNKPWVTYRDSANLPIEQFLTEISEHKFVLCPFGNGYDSYRFYECLYLGSIPVLANSPFTEHLRSYNLPFATIRSVRELENLNYEEYTVKQWSYDFVKQSYWRNICDNLLGKRKEKSN